MARVVLTLRDYVDQRIRSLQDDVTRSAEVHDLLAARIDKVESRQDRQRGREAAFTVVVAVSAVLVSFASLIVVALHN